MNVDTSIIIAISIAIGVVITKIADAVISVFKSKRDADRQDDDQIVNHYHQITEQLQNRIDKIYAQLMENYTHLSKIDDAYRDEIRELLDQLNVLKLENRELKKKASEEDNEDHRDK